MVMRRVFRIITVVLLCLAAASAWCIWRWDILFSRTTENSYILDDTEPVLFMTAGASGLYDRTFSWSCADSADCRFELYNTHTNAIDTTIMSHPTLVKTMGGEQYMHVVRLSNLRQGTYIAQLPDKGSHAEFTIRKQSTLHFEVFGDLLLSEDALQGQLSSVLSQRYEYSTSQLSAVLYTGNVLLESTQPCWEAYLTAMDGWQATIPQIGVAGSRDYERGINRVLDPRWTYRWALPLNAPERFLGTTCYIDYPDCRLILLDTETLEVLVDYTVLQTWLCRSLQEAGDKWKVVLMHHSVHSASAGFDHPRLHAALHPTLDAADLIISGNDLSYGRRADLSLSDLINAEHTVPVYVVLTSDSTEAAIPKCSPLDQRIGSNRAFFASLQIAPSELQWQTRYLAYPDSIYDAFRIEKDTKLVYERDSLPDEVIELPEQHADNGLRARRFEQLKAARQEN